MSSKKEIFIFTMSMGSGGAERVISLLLPLLIKDYRVTLFLVINNIHYQIPSEVEVHVASSKKNLGTLERIIMLPEIVTSYKRLLQNKKPWVSMSFLLQPNLINGMLKSDFPDTKFILSERCYPSMEYKSSRLKYGLYKILIKKYYNLADLVFSNSKEINNDLFRNFEVTNQMKVLYNPVNVMPSNNYSLSNEKFRIITVGRLIPVKNQVLIPEAIQLLENKNSIFLEIVGEGHLRGKLEFYKGKININLIGNSNNVTKYLANSDCFILSSNSEGFPNALLEAMAMGLPVISTNCKSGPLELLNNGESIQISQGSFAEAKFGILVNVDDIIGMAKAISFLHENSDKRKQYSKLSFERSHDFSLETIYKQLNFNILQ
ncbi:glycosyltransferase [uncultured Chryseobacterium sp.]|uniref:glycosyltransferase n=1 Tax=uncultured Chryseobacterium sp. TaxID=259322 RepID=UPI0025ED35C8|nr:glycosyltransferase [uncultured Chryseobacterium sp.]